MVSSQLRRYKSLRLALVLGSAYAVGLPSAPAASTSFSTDVLAPVHTSLDDSSTTQPQAQCSYPLPTPEQLYSGHFDYRLGDSILSGKAAPFGDVNGDALKRFPNSLAAKCATQCSKDEDYDTVTRLTKEVPLDASVPDQCTLHVRVGDVLDCDLSHSAEEMLEHQVKSTPAGCMLNSITKQLLGYPTSPEKDCWYIAPEDTYAGAERSTTKGQRMCPGVTPFTNYVKPWSYFEQEATQVFTPHNCSHVHVIAATALPLNDTSKSRRYLQLLQEKLCAMGLASTLHLGGDPDVDFATMCRSRIYVSTGGGFSDIVHTVRERLGLVVTRQGKGKGCWDPLRCQPEPSPSPSPHATSTQLQALGLAPP